MTDRMRDGVTDRLRRRPGRRFRASTAVAGSRSARVRSGRTGRSTQARRVLATLPLLPLLLAPALLGTAAPSTALPAPTTHPASGTAAAPAPRPAPMAVAPYLSPGWGVPPDPATVMAATGVRWFSLAFVLSDSGACAPRWDGYRPLTGGLDARTVRAVRKAGGDVVPSFGGGGGRRLEESCPDAVSLAGAYRKVVDAYGLKAIDVDIEGSAYRSAETQRRTLGALKRLMKAEPALTVYVTLPSYRSGPGSSLIDRAAATGVEPDAWSVMPFSFVPSAKGEDMGRISTRAVDGLRDRLAGAYGYSRAEAYAHSGISTLNGRTTEGETVTVRDFRTIAAHARRHGLGRLAFWSVNRDRPCGERPYPAEDSCSGVEQRPWQYTKTLAQYGR